MNLLVIWRECLAGVALLVASALAGWRLGRRNDSPPCRWVALWLSLVVEPMLRQRSWWARTAIIAANNGLVCLALVTLGPAGPLPWAGLIAVGAALGIALRQFPAHPGRVLAIARAGRRYAGWRWNVGMALNLLELPALAATAGLCLAQGALTATVAPHAAYHTFLEVILPMLAVAACGEALWIGSLTRPGAGSEAGTQPSGPDPRPPVPGSPGSPPPPDPA